MTFDEWLIARLRAHDAYSGASDGAPGRRVHEALERFQTEHSLPASGLADKQTVAALRRAPNAPGLMASPSPSNVEPVWMREARRFMGLKEIAGRRSNATILGWAKKLGGWIANFYTNDDIPWCGLFVGNIIATTLPRESLPSNPLSALAWDKFGRACDPCLGAILSFTRKGGGHVGFYVGEDRSYYYVLGGNQSNSVSITKIVKSRLHACRYPSTGGTPGRRVWMTARGPVSTNEA